jgi:DNA-binding transcriptional LysR family regulator
LIIAQQSAIGAAALEARTPPCVAFRSESGTMPWSLRGPNGEDAVVEPRGAIFADDISFLKKAVLAGAGIALLPSFLAAREEQANKLVRILPEWRYEGAPAPLRLSVGALRPAACDCVSRVPVAELAKITRRCEELQARS